MTVIIRLECCVLDIVFDNLETVSSVIQEGTKYENDLVSQEITPVTEDSIGFKPGTCKMLRHH